MIFQPQQIESLEKVSTNQIATDKTGTLTLNELSTCCLVFPGEAPWEIVRERKAPEGAILLPAGIDNAQDLIDRLCQAAVLANEGVLERRDGRWIIMGMPSIGRFWPWLTRLGSTARGCSPGFPRSQFFPMSLNAALPRALTCAMEHCACDPGDYGDLRRFGGGGRAAPGLYQSINHRYLIALLL